MIPRLSARMALCGLVVLGALSIVVAAGTNAAAVGGSGTPSDTLWLCRPGQAGHIGESVDRLGQLPDTLIERSWIPHVTQDETTVRRLGRPGPVHPEDRGTLIS